MAETWYEINWGEIKPLTVVRETDKCVFYLSPYSRGPVRMHKHRSLFKSLTEARNEHHLRLKKAVESAQERLQKARLELYRFEHVEE